MAMEFSIGGFNVKGWMVAVALPVLSAVSGGVYWGYDTLHRFYGVEEGIDSALSKTSANAKQISELQKSLTQLRNDTDREITAAKTFAANELQEVETNLNDDIVAKMQQLTQQLTTLEATVTSRIQTVEQTVTNNDVRGLNSEQQKVLLDLRSQVDKATTITDGIGDKLDVLQTEVDDIWKAYDELASNPL